VGIRHVAKPVGSITDLVIESRMPVKYRHALVAVLTLAGGLVQAVPSAAASRAAPIVANGSWTVYHHDDGHTGNDSSLAAVKSVTTGWTSAAMDGEVYAEPLISGGIVYAVTLNNSVYALNQSDGSVIWHRSLGTPETSGWACGNVAPMGILGTPVIDAAAGRIYVATFSSDDLYRVIGLDLATGSTLLTTTIPVANSTGTNFDWKIQQERGALALANGYVYVPFGGRAGDCFDGSTPYYGWVVAVPTNGGSPLFFKTPSGAESVWAAGGVVVDDSTHNIFFATGNAIPCGGSTMSDSIVRTSPTLGSPTYFEPNDWQANWCSPDSDLGSASPVLISPALMFTAGKHGGGFLLNPANLGGVDGQLFPTPKPATYSQADVCLGNHSDATFGGFAYAAPFVYLECDGRGLVALDVNTGTPSFTPCGSGCGSPDWHTGGSTTFGPPIVAAGAVWVASGNGLTAYNALSGALIYQSPSFGVNRFVTPAEAGGQVFVPSHTVIRSFNLQINLAVSLGGSWTSAPGAASWSSTRDDVFVRGADNALHHIDRNGGPWGAFETLDGTLGSAPTAASWAPNRIDVFMTGTDQQLWHKWWNGTSWSGWFPLGGVLTAAPAVTAWSANRLDVFAIGQDSGLWHQSWNGSAWSGWQPLGGVLTSAPGTAAWLPNRLDIFARGQDNGLWHMDWNGYAWSPWESLGGVLTSAPAASSCTAGELDVFALGQDHGLWRINFNGHGWSAWRPVGGSWTSDPAAVCRPQTNSIDVFERGTDNALWYIAQAPG
jgi:outer membrane protein assembly factor BamB